MTEERVKRRLAAIVSADVVGWSRLMGEDEAGTLASLKGHRAELIDPKVETHGGRIVGTAGDSVLVEFPSAVDAVRCSVEIQSAMADRNADLPEHRKMLFRVGINLGEVIVDGDDVFGDGVNIAARLQALADPGAVCLSGAVYGQIRGKLEFDFRDLGEQSLKNIAAPVRVFVAEPATPFTGGTKSRSLPVPSKPSIAVLPFDNMSGDPEQEYFADGVADEIITALSRFRDLFVIARNSSFTYKGTSADIKHVGRELGVRYVLEGGVRKASNRVRVVAQLIEAATGIHLWAEKYDGDLADIFDLQDRIAMEVVGVVHPTIFAAEMGRARSKRAENMDAHDLTLRGWSRWFELEPGSTAEARTLATRAIEADERFAGAYSLLAMTHFIEAILSWSNDPTASIRQARQAAHEAVKLDDADATAHSVLAVSLIFDRRYDLALAEAQRAVETNPNLPMAYEARAVVFQFTGRSEDGEDQARKAMRLSPRDPLTFFFLNTLTACQNTHGDYAAAAETASRLVALKPDYMLGHMHLAIACAELGEMERARTACETVLRVNPDLPRAWFKNAQPYQDPTVVQRELASFRKAGWDG